MSDEVECDAGKVWKKWLMCFVAYFPFFSLGLQTTYLDGPGYLQYTNEVSPASSAAGFAALASGPLCCCIVNKYGRRIGAFIVTAVQIVSWILLITGLTNPNLIVVHAILGVATGGIFTTLPIYVRELQHRNQRSCVPLSLMMVMMPLGQLVMKILMMSMERNVVEYAVMGLLVLQLLMMFVLVETPSYYVMKGKFELAKTHLSQLKCVKTESLYVKNEIIKFIEECDRIEANGNIVLLNILKNKIWRDAATVGFILITFDTIGGSFVFLDHDRVLGIAQVTVDEWVTDLTVPGVTIIGSMIGVSLLGFLELKDVLALSFATTAVALGVLGVFLQEDMVEPSTPWVPGSALIAVIASHSLAWGLPYIIMCELSNLEIRASLVGCLYAYSQAAHLTHKHTSKYIEDYTGIYALVYLFALINILGAVYCLFNVPDTSEKSVKQIESKLNKRIPVLMI